MRILVLRRWAFFVPFCAVTCIATVASHWIPRTYRSTTTIERRDHPVLINLRQTAATGGFARLFRPTLRRDVKSLDSMIEVVERLGQVEDIEKNPDGTLTEESYKRCESQARALASGIMVRLVQKDEHLDQIEISYSGSEPGLPQKIVDEVKNAYIRSTRERLAGVLNEVRTYFNNIAEEGRKKIDELEEESLRFQSEYVGVDPTDPGDLKLKITSLESEKVELVRDVNNLKTEISARQRLLDNLKNRKLDLANTNTGSALQVPQIIKSPETKAVEEEIRELQKEIQNFRLVRRMTDRHPDVVERTKRVARLREKLKGLYIADAKVLPANQGLALDEAGASSVVEQAVGWDSELAGINMDILDRKNRLETSESRLRIVDEDIKKHLELSANVFKFRKKFSLQAEVLEQTRSEYRTNMRRVAEISSVLEADESERGISFTEVMPPTASLIPESPLGKTVLALSLLAGLGAGAISVLLMELFDQTYHTTKQITRSLGLVILESVDEIVTSADRARLFRRRVIYAPVMVAILVGAVGIFCSTAYLDLERPDTYERIMRVPNSIWDRIRTSDLFVEKSTDLSDDDSEMTLQREGVPDVVVERPEEKKEADSPAAMRQVVARAAF